METRHIVVSSISEYIDAVNQFRKKADLTETILFRGQSKASWEIESSLERVKLPIISFCDYYTSIDFYKPEINAYEKNFERKASFSKGYDFDFSDYDGIKFSQFPELEYLTYLRHHGFPSPLIDFSKSEYIALFFACEDAANLDDDLENGKVFVLRDQFWNCTGCGRKEIHEIGHYIETDLRHVVQQSSYLIACRYDIGKKIWMFVPFSLDEGLREQPSKVDSVLQIEIKASAKICFLDELAKMNINHHTLYRDEDSLIKKLKFDFLKIQRRLAL